MTAPLPAGLRVDVVAGSPSTGGAYALLEIHAPAGTSVPPHSHRAGELTLLVLDGRVELVRATERSDLGPGDLARLSGASPCRLRALSAVRLLLLAVPGGIDGLADLARPGPAPDPDDVAALLAVAGVALLPTAWGAST